MSLSLDNLDERTRGLMLAEMEADIASNRLYISQRLSAKGQADYPDLLRQAITSHDEDWLAAQLRANGRLNTHETRRKPNGGTTTAAIPVTAADTLAEGEFNRFYIRGVCVRAEQDGIQQVVAYRAKPVANPRTESQMKIGASFPANRLLSDLRNSIGIDTALGLPPGPNSGLSVRLPS